MSCGSACHGALGSSRWRVAWQPMKLTFPNTSRSYNARNRCVRFGGFDSVFPVAIEIALWAIQRLNASVQDDEPSLLAVFDICRGKIEQVARARYAKRKSLFLQLSAADF